MSEFTLQNAMVITTDGILDGLQDVAIVDGLITEIGQGIANFLDGIQDRLLVACQASLLLAALARVS